MADSAPVLAWVLLGLAGWTAASVPIGLLAGRWLRARGRLEAELSARAAARRAARGARRERVPPGSSRGRAA